MSDETQLSAPERQQPETLRLSSIAPGITVNDLQASLSWYCDVLGFTIAEKFEHEGEVRGAALVAGVARLMLSQDDWAKGRDRVKGQGLRLYLSTTQDVDDVAAAIKSRGGEIASEPADMPWGARTFDLVDPDGFLLTISSGG
ncbi:MAG: VOC family protein [Gemmatimonadetes bacterium]|nr:VOC family protein [Gemmatimonadota bacterium]